MTRATVTGLLEGLVKSDFVVRMAAPGDRRSHNIKLTEAGVAVVKELVPVYKEWLRQIADKVATPQDIISESGTATAQPEIRSTNEGGS